MRWLACRGRVLTGLTSKSAFSTWTFSRFGNGQALADLKESLTYADLDQKSTSVASAINEALKGSGHERVALLMPNCAGYAVGKFGIWRSGNISVPLFEQHPLPSLEYYVKDSEASLVLTTRALADKASSLASSCNSDLLILENVLEVPCTKRVEVSDKDSDAMIVYTSGTTGKPKGAVITHKNIKAQVAAMEQAWKWTKEDCLLHVLPLHHVHGITNCLLTPLSLGASLQMLPKFEAKTLWRHLLGQHCQFKSLEAVDQIKCSKRVNLFMAVPTIYAKLLQSFDQIFPTGAERRLVKDILSKEIRLMVSGSAALAQPILDSWYQRTGHVLLERYGMTEIGMALTNPIEEAYRESGAVGKPFPGVQARIVDESNRVLVTSTDSEFNVQDPTVDSPAGELQVRGPGVFRGYFGMSEERTQSEFSPDGWFKTGDTARFDQGSGNFSILGRSSVDIIKSGGYKISALSVERVFLEDPLVDDVAVVGLDDSVYGQKLAAVISVSKEGDDIVEQIQSRAREKLPSYSIPKEIKIMKELPRNQMGKVNKKELIKNVFS